MFKPSPDHAHFRLVRRIPHPERLSPLSRRLSFSLPTLIRAKFGQIPFPGVQSILYPTLYFGKIPNHLFETGTVSDPFLHWGDAQKSHSASRRLKCVLNTANDNWLVITYFIIFVVLLMYIKLNIPCSHVDRLTAIDIWNKQWKDNAGQTGSFSDTNGGKFQWPTIFNRFFI